MLFAEKICEWQQALIFFYKRSKNQRPRLLGTVGGGFLVMGKFELIDTGRLTEKQARLNMEKCAEFLARMIQKYGDTVLGEIEERNAQLQGK